jgi:hypothetical protein
MCMSMCICIYILHFYIYMHFRAYTLTRDACTACWRCRMMAYVMERGCLLFNEGANPQRAVGAHAHSLSLSLSGDRTQ